MAAQPTAYSSLLLQTLNEQRLKNQNCDLVLISKDQQEFSAHRFLLAASSTYMSETLLTPGVTQVLMDDIDSLTLQVILDVVYTGALKLPPAYDNKADVSRIQNLGKVFGVQVLEDLCKNYSQPKKSPVVEDPKAGGDNSITSVGTSGTGLGTPGRKRGRKPGTKNKKAEPDYEGYGKFRPKKRPKLMRGPDGNFMRPVVEETEQDSSYRESTQDNDNEDEDDFDDSDDGNEFYDDDDYKPQEKKKSTRHNKYRKSKDNPSTVRYLHSGKHVWSKKPSFKEITERIESLRKSGADPNASSDEDIDSDVSLDIEEGEPDAQIQGLVMATLSDVFERIDKLKSGKSDQVEAVYDAVPQTEDDLQEWRNCTYCSQFRGRKRGRYGFHQSFCKMARYKCSLCSKPFLNVKDQSAHNCRKAVEAVVCDICGKCLRDSQSLKLHMDVHNNVKKYPCPHCGKMFRRTTQRSAHVVHVHTKERPHVCETCGARFGLKYELNRHMQRHSEYPTFACGHCDKFFYERSKLSFHIKHHHNQSYQQEQTILAITQAAMNSNEVEIEVHTTPQDMNAKKAGEILGYLPLTAVAGTSDQHQVQTLTAIDQLTQAATNAQQEYIQLTPVSYEGQNYYVYQQ